MKIVIIGNGIAGTSVARELRKLSSHEITLISEEADYFFSRTALMYVYMGHMKFEHTQPYEKDFWAKNRLQLLKKTVTSVDTQAKSVIFNDGNSLSYDVLVLATGSLPNKFGWKGQDLKGVQSLYFKQDLEQMELSSKDLKQAVVVGGGLIGIEMAEMFHSRHIPVTFLVRENSFWNTVLPQEESEMINRHIRLQKGINLHLGEELAEIEGDGKGQVQAITTKKGEKIPCQFVGLTVGVSPNVAFLKNTNIEIDRGILVDEYLQTNLPDVYAVGDCAQLRQPASHRKAIEAVWYTGKLMAPILAKTICKEKTKYVQGVWFNSAKF
ncbi:MAG: NAD(P)/FAD-dependent oxidoreductase, partial [Bacteroidia bacterium]